MASRRELFLNEITEKSKTATSVLLTREKYDEIVDAVKLMKTNGKKSAKEYWLSKHYDVIEVSLYVQE